MVVGGAKKITQGSGETYQQTVITAGKAPVSESTEAPQNAMESPVCLVQQTQHETPCSKCRGFSGYCRYCKNFDKFIA